MKIYKIHDNERDGEFEVFFATEALALAYMATRKEYKPAGKDEWTYDHGYCHDWLFLDEIDVIDK